MAINKLEGTKNKSYKIEELIEKGFIVNKDKDLANIFNNYYVIVGKELAANFRQNDNETI